VDWILKRAHRGLACVHLRHIHLKAMTMKKAKKSLQGQFCYACDRPATTWEHAPPRGFYPRRHEVYRTPRGIDYRRNLIEVPSCDAHNVDKSQEDQFVQSAVTIIALCLGRGADPHPFIERHLKKMHPRLRASLESARLVQTPVGPMYSVKPDIPTISRIMELTARALYYHENEWTRRWPGACIIESPHFRGSDLNPTVGTWIASQAIGGLTELYRRGHEGFALRGPHPEVFAYQVFEVEQRLLMRLTFYGAFHVLAHSARESESPVTSG
jgi:hypothetical protein